jgi:hypothetical protein
MDILRRLQRIRIKHYPYYQILPMDHSKILPIHPCQLIIVMSQTKLSPGIQNAPLTDLQEQSQPQQQPFVQAPPLSSQLPYNPIPMNPSGSPSYSIPYVPPLSQPTQIPPSILSDNKYVASTGNLHIVGEVINESSSL